MVSSRLPSAAVGNGRLLVTVDAWGEVLSSCWPTVDSPNQMPTFRVTPTTLDPSSDPASAVKSSFGYVGDTNVFWATTLQGLSIQDAVVDIPISGGRSAVDVHVRCVNGPHPAFTAYITPELDGRPGSQTIYWDGDKNAILAYCRDRWVAISSAYGGIVEFHCGRRGDESSGADLTTDSSLPGERLAFRNVDGLIRVAESEHATLLYAVYGNSREEVLFGLDASRNYEWPQIQQIADKIASEGLEELSLKGASDGVDQALRRSSLVLDLLMNRTTGGVIAGPDVQSGIASAPGYAAVWGRDAAWTILGALAMGRIKLAKQMLQFAVKTQAPEGLWLHRHHTDYTLASSWGLHQIDETGLLLHTLAAYIQTSGDAAFARESWPCVVKAASFLHQARDTKSGLPIQSVDLWEEREGFYAYTAASVIAGLKAAVVIGYQLNKISETTEWEAAAEEMKKATLSQFWKPDENRFISGLQSSSALPMIDADRPELSAKLQRGNGKPETAIPQYPNWRANDAVEVSLGQDVSVLALAVPCGVLPLDDARIVSTVAILREKLWNHHVGGLCRYEGDSYGGGNPWPLATLWLAIYDGACGNVKQAQGLIDWVVEHSTAAQLVPEQVHRETGLPVAAVPLSWSHAMLAIATASCESFQAWSVTEKVENISGTK